MGFQIGFRMLKLEQGHFVGKLANAGGPSNAEIGLRLALGHLVLRLV